MLRGRGQVVADHVLADEALVRVRVRSWRVRVRVRVGVRVGVRVRVLRANRRVLPAIGRAVDRVPHL